MAGATGFVGSTGEDWAGPRRLVDSSLSVLGEGGRIGEGEIGETGEGGGTEGGGGDGGS